FPADGATGVPTNATLMAKYAATAEYQGEDVTLDHGGNGASKVPATFDDTEGELRITPPDPLVPGDTYTVSWPALRGIGTATLGSGAKVSFTVGQNADTAPPSFDGLVAASWDVDRRRDDCTDTVEQRFVFDLTPGKASDDSAREGLALVVFQ